VQELAYSLFATSTLASVVKHNEVPMERKQPRILPVMPPYEPAVEQLLSAMMPRNSPVEPLKLFRTFARDLQLSGAIHTLGAYLLGRSARLSLPDRELIILRTCARCSCQYEWGVHAASYASRAGFDAAFLAATVHGSAEDPAWSPRQRALVAAVDSLHESARLSDALWSALRSEYDDMALLELLVLSGWYHAISYVANAAGVEPEPWSTPMPAAPQTASS
jgi:alkylhydroperoxidase family enzyme